MSMTMMTMMTFFNTYFRQSDDVCCGACVRGEKHIKLRKPNQDAMLIKYTKYGTIVVVADGVGSLDKSHYASKTIVRATAKSFAMFEKGLIGRKEITKTINQLYSKRVRKNYRSRAATTCIFVVLSHAYGMFAGQVGDGICFINLNDDIVILKKKVDGFLNTADAISPLDDTVRWTTKHFDISSDDTIKVMIATDGVSETIIPGMEKECMDYYLSEVSTESKYKRNFIMKKHLQNWNVRASTDDKTMIVFSRG